MPALTASLAAVAVLSVAGCSVISGNAGCVRLAMVADPVEVVSRDEKNAPVSLVARVTEDGAPREGVRVTFHLLAAGSSSGEFLGDVKTNADGMARLGVGYVPSVDRARFQRAVKVVAAHDGLVALDGVDYCDARAEAPFTLTEA